MNRGASVLFFCLVAGCAHFEDRPLSPGETAAQLEGRTLDSPQLKSFIERHLPNPLSSWPLPAWDSTNLTLAAFFYHPSLEMARAQWALAEAGKVTAGERPNPTLNLAPAYNTTTLTPSPWLFVATLDVPLETAGKRGYRIAQAARLSEAARLHLAAVAWQVRSGVKRALLDLQVAQQAEAVLREQQAFQAENFRLLEGQREAGAISAFEVAQAGIAADSARLALRDAERQTAEARVQLAEAIGLPAHALEGVTLSFDDFEHLQDPGPLAEARRQALLNRSDVLGALANYAAAQAALQLEIAKQYPDLHLGPGYEYDQGDNKWSLGLTVSLPILNQNKGPIAQAQAKRTESAAQFEAVQAGVLSEIERGLVGYRAALAKRADANELLERLRQQEQRSRARFDAGDISKGDLVALQLQLSTSTLARLEALAKSQQALLRLEEALQGPLGLPDSAWAASPRISAANPAGSPP